MFRKLWSHHWFDGLGKEVFVLSGWMKHSGLPDTALDSGATLHLCNTFSGSTPYNVRVRGANARIKAGMPEASELPLEFPAYVEHVLQAETDTASGFLVGTCSHTAPRESH